jgi:hypothetical protein
LVAHTGFERLIAASSIAFRVKGLRYSSSRNVPKVCPCFNRQAKLTPALRYGKPAG